jgi:hypothetical protein
MWVSEAGSSAVNIILITALQAGNSDLVVAGSVGWGWGRRGVGRAGLSSNEARGGDERNEDSGESHIDGTCCSFKEGRKDVC